MGCNLCLRDSNTLALTAARGDSTDNQPITSSRPRLTRRNRAFAKSDLSVRAQSPELESSHRTPDSVPSTIFRPLWGASVERVRLAVDPSRETLVLLGLTVLCRAPTPPLRAGRNQSSGSASPGERQTDLLSHALPACARA